MSLFCFLGFVWGGWWLITGDITSCCCLPASRLSCHRLDSHNGSAAFAMSLDTKRLIVANLKFPAAHVPEDRRCFPAFACFSPALFHPAARNEIQAMDLHGLTLTPEISLLSRLEMFLSEPFSARQQAREPIRVLLHQEEAELQPGY